MEPGKPQALRLLIRLTITENWLRLRVGLLSAANYAGPRFARASVLDTTSSYSLPYQEDKIPVFNRLLLDFFLQQKN